MTRWFLLTLLTGCAQAHWECVDDAGEVLDAGDATCKDYLEVGDAVFEDAAKACADEGCTCRVVTDMCLRDAGDPVDTDTDAS